MACLSQSTTGRPRWCAAAYPATQPDQRKAGPEGPIFLAVTDDILDAGMRASRKPWLRSSAGMLTREANVLIYVARAWHRTCLLRTEEAPAMDLHRPRVMRG
jgi:hypothetical protein